MVQDYLQPKKIGTILVIVGAMLLAINNDDFSKYGYILFFLSSVIWAYIGYIQKEKELLVMQVVFTIINILGIYNWLL